MRLASGRADLDDAALEGVAHEIGPRREAQLVEDVAAVGLDGADAQEELTRDLLIRVAERDEAQDLALALGQVVLGLRA